MSSDSIQQRVAVIGGGISGLAAAHRLRELAPELGVTLFEASGRLGGVLETVREDGFLWERSADNFITSLPGGIELCRRLGIEGELLSTDETRRRAFVVRRGKLEPIPEGFVIMAPTDLAAMATTPILGPLGKLRLAWERFVPRRTEAADESLASFAVRRFGRQTYERLIQPLVGGIYTADPTRLSMLAAMPRFVALEREYGSVIRGLRAQRGKSAAPASDSGARYSMFVAPRDGMSRLVEKLAERIAPAVVRLNTPVARLEPVAEGGWRVFTGHDPAGTLEEAGTFAAVIVATPSAVAARLVRASCEELSTELNRIQHAGCAVAVLAYPRNRVAHPLNGFGAVVPLVERREALSISFASVKYPGRAPTGEALFRVFIGGACQGELLSRPDDQLLRIARGEVEQLLGATGEPTRERLCRWPATMPQYHVGHVELVQRIEGLAAGLAGLELAGNAYHGVGIPQCIESGETAAKRVATRLQERLGTGTTTRDTGG